MKLNNKGSATLEATMVIPIFIFWILGMYHMAQCKLVENEIYRMGVDTAEEIAQYGYLHSGSVYTPELLFDNHIEDEELLEDYIEGGTRGVSFWGTRKLEDDYFSLQINYTIGVKVPFFPKLTSNKTIVIEQKLYTGNILSKEDDSSDKWVYITDNKEAYHLDRGCTHLCLSITTESINTVRTLGYKPCDFCGDKAGSRVIITDYGDSYHSSDSCSGLKRTVYRVRLSEIGGIGACSRCGEK